MKKTCLALFTLMLLLASAGSALAQTAGVNATVRVNPLEVEIVSPDDVEFGQWFSLEVHVRNLGAEPVNNTRLEINGSQKISIRGRKKMILGVLNSNQKEIVVFQVRANLPGEYVVQAEATGDQLGQEISASDATVISVTGTLGMKLIFLRDLFTQSLPRFFS